MVLVFTTWSAVIDEFVKVCGREENEEDVMTNTFNSFTTSVFAVDTALATAVPLCALVEVDE